MAFLSRIGYISAYKGGVFLAVIFTVLAFTLPSGVSTDFIKVVLTVSTFLFAILAGFIISRQDKRYDKLREVLSHVDALWMSLFNTLSVLGPKVKKDIADIIDERFCVAYDYEIWDYQKVTFFEETIKKLYNYISKLKPKKFAHKEFIEGAFNKLKDIEVLDQQTGEIAKEKILPGEWIVMYILTGIIIFCVFFIKELSLHSIIFTILLSTAVVVVMLIIRDLNNLRLKGEYLGYESGEQVFDAIGKPRYYYYAALVRGYTKKPVGKTFRIGFHEEGKKPIVLTYRQDEDWRKVVKRAYYQGKMPGKSEEKD
ncbi:hypothetical protein KY336_00965 [Candidatus Woesearchaeota archaeon]|nr:hypothetical protein [Candidatus Woesearchaeota archaeon]